MWGGCVGGAVRCLLCWGGHVGGPCGGAVLGVLVLFAVLVGPCVWGGMYVMPPREDDWMGSYQCVGGSFCPAPAPYQCMGEGAFCPAPAPAPYQCVWEEPSALHLHLHLALLPCILHLHLALLTRPVPAPAPASPLLPLCLPLYLPLYLHLHLPLPLYLHLRLWACNADATSNHGRNPLDSHGRNPQTVLHQVSC